MKVVNRSAITLTFKKPFIDWHNQLFPEMPYEENMLGESKTYLINQIFNNADQVLKKHYKEIFEIELDGVCIDESEWPQKRTYKMFHEWFSVEVSDWVTDLSNQSMFR
ncbi:MAG: hypothetical protein PHE56_08090 [Bacteroidales bacterium]|nr:hypothetical protein [Bacteroidales bacterium]